MPTYIKTFKTTDPYELDTLINKWVDDTDNYIIDIKLSEEIGDRVGLIVIVMYMSKEDLDSMMMPMSAGIDFGAGPEGDNVLNLDGADHDGSGKSE